MCLSTFISQVSNEKDNILLPASNCTFFFIVKPGESETAPLSSAQQDITWHT